MWRVAIYSAKGTTTFSQPLSFHRWTYRMVDLLLAPAPNSSRPPPSRIKKKSFFPSSKKMSVCSPKKVLGTAAHGFLYIPPSVSHCRMWLVLAPSQNDVDDCIHSSIYIYIGSTHSSLFLKRFVCRRISFDPVAVPSSHCRMARPSWIPLQQSLLLCAEWPLYFLSYYSSDMRFLRSFLPSFTVELSFPYSVSLLHIEWNSIGIPACIFLLGIFFFSLSRLTFAIQNIYKQLAIYFLGSYFFLCLHLHWSCNQLSSRDNHILLFMTNHSDVQTVNH